MSDQLGYSSRFIRFVRLSAHAEAFRAAYLDQSSSSRNELARLHREYETLPPRHDGWCPGECPSERCGLTEQECGRRRHFHSPCLECRRLRQSVQYVDIGREVDYGGHRVTSGVVPSPMVLDLERALSVLGDRESSSHIAHWLNGDEAA